jgi:mannose-1-phosphate guanylyltransferase
MILCAGLGERLRPLTRELPKPLVPVGDRSVLAHICQQLRQAGYSSAVANTHWMSDKISAHSDGLQVTLTLIHEAVIRGVAGGVAGARPWLDPPVIVWNGDILVEAPPLEALSTLAAATSGICLAVAPSRGMGTVGLDAAGRVVRLRGESHGNESRSGDYIGLAGLGALALSELPDQGCLIGDYCLPRLRRGEPVYTCPASGPWWDVGSLPAYLSANQHWLTHHSNHDEGSFVAATATVEAGVSLERSVVGPHSRVGGSGALVDCIVWPGSNAMAPLSGSIVTPSISVHVAPFAKP